MRRILALLLLLAASSAAARELPLSEYLLLERGMSLAEVLLRVGQPDRETVIDTLHVHRTLWYYMPERLTGGWLTVVTFDNAERVAELERTRVPPAAARAPTTPSFRDYTLVAVGMSEAEVYLRLGEPDRESVISTLEQYRKIWYYLPEARSRGPVTIIHFDERGRVAHIAREPS